MAGASPTITLTTLTREYAKRYHMNMIHLTWPVALRLNQALAPELSINPTGVAEPRRDLAKPVLTVCSHSKCTSLDVLGSNITRLTGLQ